MQNIVFYAAAKETLGMVRDYSNMHLSEAPVLTIGVAVCLRMRLFADVEVPTPYPIASLNGIAKWHWSMDADFDRSTSCKLVADEGGISVQTVTDTVNGETTSFTEFVIPISDMNTEELAAWLGNEATKPGLTGELVGYDNEDHAVFVLQIEDFKVRNRVAGLGAPNAVDEGFLTRSYAEQIIQSAVSSSAAEKQDKLTPANGGVGISVTSSGIISTADVPQSAVTGLAAALDAKQDNLAAGYRMELVSGSTVDQARYFAIEPAITASANQTTTVVLSAGKAYEIHAVANNAKVLLNRENPVGGSRTFGLEAHAEIFVANTGYIQTGENVVLSQPLEPDAVNNCTVRFHDNLAIISVEDHIAGYIVNVSSGTTAGSLYYGLADAAVASQEYISVNDSLAGVPLNLGGATVSTTKHLVGNGYADTLVTGDVAIASGSFTVANCALQNVNVTSGTLTLGDAYIPAGSTVAVSGGGLAVEKVVGEGSASVIDYGGNANPYTVQAYKVASVSNVKFTNAYGTPAYTAFRSVGNVFTNCTFTGNTTTATDGGGGVFISESGSCLFSGCVFSGNSTTATATPSQVSVRYTSAVGTFKDCTFTGNSSTDLTMRVANSGRINFVGTNGLPVGVLYGDSTGTLTLTSGATIDLTGNANAAPIIPGGNITFEQGGATVLYSSGTLSGSYTMDNVTLPAGAKLTNTAVVNLGGKRVAVASGTTAAASGVTYSGGDASASAVDNGGAFQIGGGTTSARFDNCSFIGNHANNIGGALFVHTGAIATLNGCTFQYNTCTNTAHGAAVGITHASAFFSGCSVLSATTTKPEISLAGGAPYVQFTDCTFEQGRKISFFQEGSGAEIALAGSNVIQSISGSAGKVTMSSGASVVLSSSIEPGGAITIPAGAVVTIIGSNGVSSGYFSDLAVTGSTITNLGRIYGATVTVPPLEDGGDRGPWELETTEGTSTVSAVSGESQQIVIEGGLISIIGQ